MNRSSFGALCHIGWNLRKAYGAHAGVCVKQLNLIGNSAKNEVQNFFFMFCLRLESTSIAVYSEWKWPTVVACFVCAFREQS